ncbi:organic solvent ABC transporter permease [Marinobacter nauticus]|uniref:organic solvent ABC transporter permease n=1 Tax=Marinobacter nauticus TaxID=2743 RepID=UPI001CD7A716|nr:organic solvent ABC transporter permease [Marinobacter nauticus]MCA0911493.1 organic solvent ABC transporter permease [Marinobacter nauticus]
MKLAHLTRFILPLSAAIALTGCFDSGSSSGSDDTRTGQIHFQGVGGLTYQTSSQSGKTNTRGEFRYYPGETLSVKVGNLPIAEGIPAREYVTFLEFQEDTRTALQTPGVDDEGLSSHQVREQLLFENSTLMNLSRFLLALNWTENVDEDEGIDIRERVINQLNRALDNPNLPNTVNFNVSTSEFTAENSPANQILAEICFYPEDDPLCGQPPTQEEIDNATERPVDGELDPDIDYKEDLEALRERILQSVRNMDEFDNEQARNYLRRELAAITRALSRQYYLSPEDATHPAGDNGIKSVKVRKIRGDAQLAQLQAQSTRPTDVYINAESWQEAEVEYVVDGPKGGESEILVNFRPEGTYRWVRKQIRILID